MRVHHPAIDIRWVLLRAGLTVLLIGLLAPLFSFLLPRPVGAVSLTIASSTSSTPESMNNTTFAATDTSIASSSLPAGTYLVTWGAALSNSNSTRSSFARLVRGSTEIGLAGSEMNSATTANNGRSPGGFWLGTLDGTEALTIEYRVDNTSSTAYIDSKYIKAIRLDDKLTQDLDYFTTGSQESDVDEVTDAGTASPTTVKSLTKTFHSSISQSYLILASMEISPDSTTNDCAAQLTVDGSAVTTQTGEGEDATDIYTYVAADLRTIGTGSKTISLDAQSVGGATCDYMRSRIYVFRANVFDQLTENESLSESTLTSATWTDKNTLAYTPRQTEDVLLLTSQLYGSSSTGSPIATRIYNSTDTVAYADQRSHAINNAGADYYSGVTAASLNVSAAKTFKTQYQRSTGTGTVKIKDSRLIAWSMTLSAGNKQRLTVAGTSLDPNDLSATTSTSYVDTNASIAASSLPAGKYLVLWGARLSSASANEISWAQLVRGSTTIAEKGAEANGQIWAGGYWLGSLDGTEALKIQQKTSLGTATANARTKFIKAIRIDDKLTEDVDYFTTGSQESGSDEVTDAGTASWTTVKSLTKTFHPSTTQDYIVLSDMEVSNDDVSYECEARLTIDGTSTNTQTLDGEDVDDISGHVVADLTSIGTGSKTISLEGKSVESAKCDFRRSRIYVFRANIFDQVAENESLGESTTTSVGTWVDKTSLTYTPNQAEDVLLIASHMISADNSGTVTSIGIYNSTDAVMLAGPMPHIMNAPAGNYGTVATADVVSISSAKTYKGQFQMQSGSTISRTKEARLIAWSMTLKLPQMTQGSYRWFENTDDGSPTTAIVAQNTAGSIVVDTPFRLRQIIEQTQGTTMLGTHFYLQYAEKSGTCDTGFSGETYTAVKSSGDITWYNNSGVADGASISSTGNDPTSSNTVLPQTYRESNTFTNAANSLGTGYAGVWDYALTSNTAAAGKSYCFRVLYSYTNQLNAYSQIAEIAIQAASTGPTLEQQMRHGRGVIDGVETPLN